MGGLVKAVPHTLGATPCSVAATVIDADGLNILSELPEIKLPPHTVLTPHPKELSRLLKITTEEIQVNRVVSAEFAAAEIQRRCRIEGAPDHRDGRKKYVCECDGKLWPREGGVGRRACRHDCGFVRAGVCNPGRSVSCRVSPWKGGGACLCRQNGIRGSRFRSSLVYSACNEVLCFELPAFVGVGALTVTTDLKVAPALTVVPGITASVPGHRPSGIPDLRSRPSRLFPVPIKPQTLVPSLSPISMRLSVTFPSAITYTASPPVTENTDCSGTRMAEDILPFGSLIRAIIPGFILPAVFRNLTRTP